MSARSVNKITPRLMTSSFPKTKIFSGVVVSDRMTKTIVVEVERKRLIPKYRKQVRITRRVKVHDEDGAYHVGDRVHFVETRPYSREKRWRALPKEGKITEVAKI